MGDVIMGVWDLLVSEKKCARLKSGAVLDFCLKKDVPAFWV